MVRYELNSQKTCASLDNKAVIIIDMLNDFVTGNLKCERAKRIIPNLKKLIEVARKNNIPVIYSNDAHFPEDAEVLYCTDQPSITISDVVGLYNSMKSFL